MELTAPPTGPGALGLVTSTPVCVRVYAGTEQGALLPVAHPIPTIFLGPLVGDRWLLPAGFDSCAWLACPPREGHRSLWVGKNCVP